MMNIVICAVIAVAGFAILMAVNSTVAKSLKKKENTNKNTGTIIFIIMAIVYLVVLAGSCYFLL